LSISVIISITTSISVSIKH